MSNLPDNFNSDAFNRRWGDLPRDLEPASDVVHEARQIVKEALEAVAAVYIKHKKSLPADDLTAISDILADQQHEDVKCEVIDLEQAGCDAIVSPDQAWVESLAKRIRDSRNSGN